MPLVWQVVADSQERATAVKKHPDYSEHGYFLAVEMAFKQWEAMQNVGSPQKSSDHVKWCLDRSKSDDGWIWKRMAESEDRRR